MVPAGESRGHAESAQCRAAYRNRRFFHGPMLGRNQSEWRSHRPVSRFTMRCECGRLVVSGFQDLVREAAIFPYRSLRPWPVSDSSTFGRAVPPQRRAHNFSLGRWRSSPAATRLKAAACMRRTRATCEDSIHCIRGSSKLSLENARHHTLLERWIEPASQGGGRFLIRVIDEVQGMSQREWLWLGSEWPTGSGLSFTASLPPVPCAQGFRFATARPR